MRSRSTFIFFLRLSGKPALRSVSHFSPYLNNISLPMPRSSRRIDSYFFRSLVVGRFALMERVMSSRASSLNFDILSLYLVSLLSSIIAVSALDSLYVRTVTRIDADLVTHIYKERHHNGCLLYTSDAADDLLCVDLGGRRIIKKK